MPVQSRSLSTLSFFVFFALLTLTNSADSQGIQNGPPKAVPKCDLQLDKSPTIRGFKLGMDENKAAEIVGKEFRRGPSSGDATFFPNGTSGFDGVDNIVLTSIDGRINLIWVTYIPRFKDTNEFASLFIPQIDLPNASWSELEGNQGVVMNCTDFTASLHASGQGRLRLRDTAIDRRKAEEKEKVEEAQRKALKP